MMHQLPSAEQIHLKIQRRPAQSVKSKFKKDFSLNMIENFRLSNFENSGIWITNFIFRAGLKNASLIEVGQHNH